jgi:hypothetical protein
VLETEREGNFKCQDQVDRPSHVVSSSLPLPLPPSLPPSLSLQAPCWAAWQPSPSGSSSGASCGRFEAVGLQVGFGASLLIPSPFSSTATWSQMGGGGEDEAGGAGGGGGGEARSTEGGRRKKPKFKPEATWWGRAGGVGGVNTGRAACKSPVGGGDRTVGEGGRARAARSKAVNGWLVSCL